jgi:FMN phosphatase YigB (HAD superfamily)
MTKPKTIFFDWHNTLCTTYFWSNILEKKDISQFLFQDNPNIVNDWMLGKYTSEEICELISHDTKIDKAYLFTELENSFKDMHFYNQDIPQLIKDLKAKDIKCVIATDNMDCFTRFAIPHMKLDEIFDDVLNSYYQRCFKYTYENGLPFFDKYLQEDDLEYMDVILIDDSIDKSGKFKDIGFEIRNFSDINDVTTIIKQYLV